MPLLIPSFLWAIGLSTLRMQLGLGSDSILSGLSGSIIAFSSLAIPLVVYASFVSARGLSQGQVDAAYLSGGDKVLLRYAMRSAFPLSLVTGCLGGILTLSDPGPGQILGFSGVAAEILVSFSALYDFSLAAKQSFALAAVVLIPLIPLAIWIAPRLVSGLMAKDVKPARLQRRPWASIVGPVFLLTIASTTLFLPIAGFIPPLLVEFPLERAFQEVTRTFGNTIFYAFAAGLIASILAFVLALTVGRSRALRQFSLGALLVILCLPPSLGALGMIQMGSVAPASLDFLLRSRFTVAVLLALRFLPVATFLAIRGIGLSSPTWASAAAIHGVSLPRYLWKVLLPWYLPTAFLSCLLVALLATAELNIVLLLRPPGEDSLPIAIFTVMANAPEALVSMLSLLYVTGALGVLLIGWSLAKKESSS
ncbi:MAG: hypothetical protein JNL01_14225 [Bdellovibrionales bacterium]|nr:hypothetical protein [Bdellovibrionales bacterium]